MDVIWSQVWQVIVLPVLSGMAGFLQVNWNNYMVDNKFDKFEWAETIRTFFKLGIPAFGAWLALNGFGVEVEAWVPTLTVIVLYWVTRMFKTDVVSLKKEELKRKA